MKLTNPTNAILFVLIAGCTMFCNPKPTQDTDFAKVEASEPATDPLPSWNEGQTKQAILDYVADVTNPSSTNFIEIADRIATFDNDGTLWSEQPLYFQIFFVMDRVKAMAADHPEWKTKQPYKAVLDNDMEGVKKNGVDGLLKLLMETHAGMSTAEFDAIIGDWIKTAQHPTKNRPYTDLVFQPMIELIDYLEDNEFQVFIISAGGIEFMRPWAEEVYGLPKNQVFGSSIKTEYDYNDGNPVLKRLPEAGFIDNKGGKPVGINEFIGRKPVVAGGNSDDDLQMLQWTASNTLKSLNLYVHHTDSVREWAYDRTSMIGKLSKGLDEANEKGWAVIDMANDWKVIYPFELE